MSISYTKKREEMRSIKRKEYVNIHLWLRKEYGKANKCEMESCDEKSKRFSWALKRGKKYEKKRNNFIQLCHSCHKKYDTNYIFIKEGEIVPDLIYNLTNILRTKIPQFRTMTTLKKYIVRDFFGDNILKVIISGEDRDTKYEIKGSNIIKYLKKYGHGIMLSKKQKIK